MKYISLLFIPLFVVVAQEPTIEKNARTGYEAIRAEDLKRFDTYLSSDALQGRETSYEGEHLAAKYIADHFKALGLKPIGDDGTYLQHYSVELTRVSGESKIVTTSKAGAKTFRWLNDFFTFAGRDTSVRGEVAFVGYADNKLPETSKGVLAGKVVFAFVGERRPSNDTTSVQLMRRGPQFHPDPSSVATIMIMDDNGPVSYERFAAQLGSFGILNGRMQLKNAETARPSRAMPLVFYASSAIAREILKSDGTTLDKLRELSFKDSVFTPYIVNGATVSIDTKVIHEERQAENVVGLLEGSDPVLKSQVVVFSAHFDHLGVGANGAIYHGADDDGSGTSMVMDLAQAFSKNPVRPKRSLLFITVSGEEKGLLGSSYYTSHPIIPLDQTIADFNTDMIGRMDTIHEKTATVPYTYLIGSDKISTELDSILQVANEETENLQLDYTYDSPNDPNHFYTRSDHYNFARKGVPIAFFFTGVHADYHRPTDTVDKILFDRIVKIGHVVFYAGWKTANFGRMFTKDVKSSEYQQ